MPADAPTATTGAAAGVIHDLGYRHYDGPRLGRAQIVRALAWHSFRVRLRLRQGREGQDRPGDRALSRCSSPRWSTRSRWPTGTRACVFYDAYQPVLRDLVMTIFVAVQAPELVSRDLRSRVLPLYFSRPIKMFDYPLAKYLAFTAACAVMIEVPLLVLYLGTIVNAHGGAAVWAQTRELIPGLLVGLHVGGGAGRDQPVPREPDRPPGLRDRHGRDLLPGHVLDLAEILLQVENHGIRQQQAPGDQNAGHFP